MRISSIHVIFNFIEIWFSRLNKKLDVIFSENADLVFKCLQDGVRWSATKLCAFRCKVQRTQMAVRDNSLEKLDYELKVSLTRPSHDLNTIFLPPSPQHGFSSSSSSSSSGYPLHRYQDLPRYQLVRLSSVILNECILYNRFQLLDALVSAGRLDINAPLDKYGWTVLHKAAYVKDLKLLRLLLDHGAKIDATDCNGNTPLHIAVQSCQVNTISQRCFLSFLITKS